jgi:hypothetical protein
MGAGKTTFYACHRDLPSGSVGPQMAQLQKAFSVSGGVKVPIGQLGMTTISALICDENTRKIASDKCNRTITRRTRGAHDKCMCSSRSERQA